MKKAMYNWVLITNILCIGCGIYLMSIKSVFSEGWMLFLLCVQTIAASGYAGELYHLEPKEPKKTIHEMIQ